MVHDQGVTQSGHPRSPCALRQVVDVQAAGYAPERRHQSVQGQFGAALDSPGGPAVPVRAGTVAEVPTTRDRLTAAPSVVFGQPTAGRATGLAAGGGSRRTAAAVVLAVTVLISGCVPASGTATQAGAPSASMDTASTDTASTDTASTDTAPAATGPAVSPPPAPPATAPTVIVPPVTAPSMTAPTAPSPVPVAPVAAAPGTAVAQLQELPVKGRAPKTGYDRDMFGTAWTDDVTVDGGRNGCDTRNDILARDLTGHTTKAGTGGCLVLTGVLADPFTASTIPFKRGDSTSSDVQIDHVVALSDAWLKGAQQLNERTRRDLANDPLNLLAVDGPSNSAKGDGDAATWLPPNRASRCDYVALQVAVKHRYGLWVTEAERDAIVRVLGDCPQHPATDPRSRNVPAMADRAGYPTADGALPAPAEAPAPAVPVDRAPAAGEPAGGGDPRLSSCQGVIDAGYGPYTRGQPEYDWYRDGDNDGTVCE